MQMTIQRFNTLSSREKWDLYERLTIGKWVCPGCGQDLPSGPVRCSPFPGAQLRCSDCDQLLTRRTGGGQQDPFNWLLVPERAAKTRAKR